MNAANLEGMLSSWLGTFLASRDLQVPNGRPLYEYHVTDEEFAELRTYLVGANSCQNKMDSRNFAAVWFLYAAEWWKRSYSGGAWGWAGVFGSVPIDEPEAMTRQTWVLRAKSYWRLQGALPTARPYLGTVILNAGIPSKLIEDSHGKIAALFRLVFRRIGGSVERTHYETVEAVREQQYLLPQTYREESIFSLIASVVESVLLLRQEYCLTESADPLAKLEQVCPSWRRRFPLSLNAPATGRLLKGLVREAVAAAAARPPFFIRRALRREDGGKVSPVCLIDCASSVKQDQLDAALGLRQGSLPQSFELSARSDHAVVAIGRGVRRGGDVLLRIDRTRLPDNWIESAIILEISQFGRVLHSFEVLGGDAPDLSSPWIFTNAEPIAELIRTGSGHLRSGMLLCAPARARLMGTRIPSEIGRWNDRVLYLLGLESVTVIIDQDEFHFSFSTDNGPEPAVMWRGKRLQIESTPVPVFVSRPRLTFVTQDGEQSHVPPSQLFWKPLGAAKDTSLQETGLPSGVGYLSWRDGGSIQARLRAVCLPESASIQAEPNASGRGGVIRLRNWPAREVLLVGPEGVQAQVSSPSAGCWNIEVNTTAARVPVFVSLQVNWPGLGIQTVRLPYPTEGIQIGDEEGNLIEAGRSLRIEDLLGMRIQLQSPAISARWNMVLALRGASGGAIERCISYHSLDATIVVVRLFELIPDISDMLSSVEGFDVGVDVRFELRGRKYPAIRIKRFNCELVPNHEIGICSVGPRAEATDEVGLPQQLWALPLQSPKRAIELPSAPGYWSTPTWLFSPHLRSAGNWLIYGDADAKEKLRPLAWTVAPDEQCNYSSFLKNAVGIEHRCGVSCDHIPRRSMPLLRAKAVLDELIAGFPKWSPVHRSNTPERPTA